MSGRKGLSAAGWALSVALALAVAGCASEPLPSQPSFYQSLAHEGARLDPEAAASMISGYRRNNQLGDVTLDPQLMKMAEDQARAMATRDKLDHNVAGNFKDRLRKSGYRAQTGAENIGAGYHTLAEAFSGWRDSPQHKANMLLKDATHMGIAAVYVPNTKYKVFWALVLAQPSGARVAHAAAD
jgi:uncharacterized protein YkwD